MPQNSHFPGIIRDSLPSKGTRDDCDMGASRSFDPKSLAAIRGVPFREEKNQVSLFLGKRERVTEICIPLRPPYCQPCWLLQRDQSRKMQTSANRCGISLWKRTRDCAPKAHVTRKPDCSPGAFREVPFRPTSQCPRRGSFAYLLDRNAFSTLIHSN